MDVQFLSRKFYIYIQILFLNARERNVRPRGKRLNTWGLRDYREKCRKESAMTGREKERWRLKRGKRGEGRRYERSWNDERTSSRISAMMERGGGTRCRIGHAGPECFRGGALGGGWWQRSPRTAGGLLGRSRNLSTNGHATSGEPSLPASPSIHYLLVPCQPPHRHSYLILIYYLPRSVPL